MAMSPRPVDWLNLYAPVRDAVESPGVPGQVLRSQGAGAAPIWSGEGSTSVGPGEGSGTDDGILSGPVFVFGDDETTDGPIELVPPTLPNGIGSFLMHIQGMTESRNQGDQGAFDLLLQVDLFQDAPVAVTVQGTAADLDLYAAQRPDGRLVVLIGNVRTRWVEPFLSITHLWVAGSPNAGSWASGWSAQQPISLSGYQVWGAQPIGHQQGLGVPDAITGSGGRYVSCLGGFSSADVVIGALLFRITPELPLQSLLQLSGSGLDGADPTVNCWLRLGREIGGGDPNQLEVVNLSPVAAPYLRAGRDLQGRPVLVAGDVGTVWRRPALALAQAVFARELGPTLRAVWPSELRTDLSDVVFTATAVQRPIEGSSGGGGGGGGVGPGDLQPLTPGSGLSGAVYDGSSAVTWSADGSSGGPYRTEALTPAGFISGGSYNGLTPQTWTVNGTHEAAANALMARDGNADTWARIFHGDLDGTATAATRLTPGRTINGVHFDGTADIVIGDLSGGGPTTIATLTPGAGIAGAPFNGTTAQTWTVDASALPAPTLKELTPGAHLQGDPYVGSSACTWNVLGAEGATPGSLAQRDAGGGLTATPFKGDLTGNAASASRLLPGRRINDVLFDGTSDIQIPIDDPKRVLKAGDEMTGTLTMRAGAMVDFKERNRSDRNHMLYGYSDYQDEYGVSFNADGLASHYANRGLEINPGGGRYFRVRPDQVATNSSVVVENGEWLVCTPGGGVSVNTGGKTDSFLYAHSSGSDEAAFGVQLVAEAAGGYGNAAALVWSNKLLELAGHAGHVNILGAGMHYEFTRERAWFDNALAVRQRGAQGAGISILANSTDQAVMDFKDRWGDGLWGQIGATWFRTDYTSANQLWLRAALQEPSGFVQVDAGGSAAMPFIFSRAGTRVAYVTQDGNWVPGYGYLQRGAIEPLELGLEAVKALQPVSFMYQRQAAVDWTPSLGFMAQNVESVVPAAVQEAPDDGSKTVAPDLLIPVLVKAVQELSDRLDALEAAA